VTLCAELVLLVPGLPEYGVRMRVDETGGEHTAATIHHFAATICGQEIFRGTNRGNPSVGDRDGDVGQNPGVGHFLSLAGSRRPGAGDDLGGVYEEEITHVGKIELKTTRFALMA
jgi:hypothetical protein